MFGLIGFPNVGKSTILSVVTSATPKIADYEFTTIEPNLGVVKTSFGDSFVIADIPGIIEGASKGVGLGLQFLRHIERTRLLLHVIDVSGTEGRDPVEDFYKVNEELKTYSEKLSKRKQIIVANKVDIMQDESVYQKLKQVAKENKLEIFQISAATNTGLKELFTRVSEILKELPKEELFEIQEKVVYTLKEDEKGFDIKKEKGAFIVFGPAIERLMAKVNVQDNESLAYFQKTLENLGVNARLKKLDVQEGDTIKLEDWEFEWYE